MGLLMNITKFPLDHDGEELTQLGLLMSNLDSMKVGMWPFNDQVFIAPQAAAAWHWLDFSQACPGEQVHGLHCHLW